MMVVVEAVASEDTVKKTQAALASLLEIWAETWKNKKRTEEI